MHFERLSFPRASWFQKALTDPGGGGGQGRVLFFFRNDVFRSSGSEVVGELLSASSHSFFPPPRPVETIIYDVRVTLVAPAALALAFFFSFAGVMSAAPTLSLG